MWLFISTEVMLFTALIASYLVLRFSASHGWPTADQVQLNHVLGWINTAVLMLSGLTMWCSVWRCAAGSSRGAKAWLLATIVLGITFLGIKFLEYKVKYDHGIFPQRGRSLIHNAADDDYLSRAVVQMREEIRRLEQTSAAGEPASKQQRLDDLYLLQSGVVDWTQFVVGRTGDPATKRQAIAALAHQIYRQHDDPQVDRYIESELATVQAELDQLNQQLATINADRNDAQRRLRELLPKKDSGDEAVLREYERVSETVSRLTDDVTALNKDKLPMKNRLQAIEMLSSGPGINQTYGVRLPIVIAGGHQWSSLYYLLTGTHAIHLIAGLLGLIFLLGSRLNVRWLGTLENLGLYWHFVDVIWLVVFAVIYLV